MAKTKEMTAVGKTVKPKKKMSRRRKLFILYCCLLPVLNWLIFYVFVNLSAFTMAFTNKAGEVSLDNFVRFWNELHNPISDIRLAFRNTFITFGVELLMFPIQVLVSYFIYKKIPGANLYRILFFLPTIIFSVALAMIFSRMISPQGFIAQGIQRMMDLSYAPELVADSRFANITVLLHKVWLTFPGNLIIWGGTFARIPTEVIESSKIDGVNWWQEFTKITVPLVWPTVGLQLVLSFCGIFGATGSVFLLTKGNYGTMTLSSWLYLQIYNNAGNINTSNVYNYMSAVGLLLTIVAITISRLIRHWTDKAFNDVDF